MWRMIGNSPTLIMDSLIRYRICRETKCISFSHIYGRRFGKHFWQFGQILWPYLAPIFSNGQDFGHSGPFGLPAIIRSLIKTNCMKLASLSNPSRNLYLIVYNLVLGTRPSMRKIKQHYVMIKNLCMRISKICTHRE